MIRLETEDRVEILQQAVRVLRGSVEWHVARIESLTKRVLELEQASGERTQQELDILHQELIRSRIELEKSLTDVYVDAEEPSSREKKGEEKKARKGHGPREQPLEEQEVVHVLDEADMQCQDCGKPLKLWPEHEDVTQEITVIERRFLRTKHVRHKYRCECCGTIEMPLVEPRVVPGGIYSNDMALEIAAMKYVDQLPFDRIARIFGREGLTIDSQTLWDQVNALAHHLEPAYERLRTEILSKKVVGLDQTHWKVIGSGKSWQMWEIATPDQVYFFIAETKSTSDGEKITKGFTGIFMCDAFSTHGALANLTGVRLAHCWAHPFRMAEEALSSDRVRAEKILHFIGSLYKIDERAGGDLSVLRGLRDTESRAAVKDFWAWKDEQLVLPSSPIGKLLRYLENHKEGLQRFLDDPEIPLDNNHSERGYLWPAIGRRSFVGSKSKRGTQVAAIFYSLAETARRSGLDPKKYFKIALTAALAGTKIPLPHEVPRAASPPSNSEQPP